MPCRVDEVFTPAKVVSKQITEAMALFDFAFSNSISAPMKPRDRADNWYPETLCAHLSTMSVEERDLLIYDARNQSSRRLADWWEEHEQMDRDRWICKATTSLEGSMKDATKVRRAEMNGRINKIVADALTSFEADAVKLKTDQEVNDLMEKMQISVVADILKS